MNTQTLTAVLEALGLSYLSAQVQPAITAYMLINSNATVADVVAAIDGTMKHAAREKVGWLVDFVWPFVSPYLDTVITEDAEAAKAALPSTG